MSTGSDLRIEKVRGYVALVGPPIDAVATDTLIPVPRQTTPCHVTLFTKQEASIAEEAQFLGDIIPPLDLGLGKRGDVYFKVLWWPQGHRLRRQAGLAWKDFHVTLSSQDRHDIDKGVTAIAQPSQLSATQAAEIINDLQAMQKWGRADKEGVKKAIDIVAALFTGYHTALLDDKLFDSLRRILAKHDPYSCKLLVALYLQANADSIAANLRYADDLVMAHDESRTLRQGADGDEEPSDLIKEAMSYYAKAHRLAKESGGSSSEAVEKYCLKEILRCSGKTEFLPIFTEREVDHETHQRALVEVLDRQKVLEESISEWEASADMTDAPDLSRYLTLSSRERLYVRHPGGTLFKLPRFFRWLIPFRLAVMSTPRSADDVAILQELDITLIVTLTKETPLAEGWFRGKRTRNVFLPVENYKAPTIEQVEHFITLATGLPPGEAVLVHCGGGKGRAGTFAACYLCACGFTTERLSYPAYSAAGAMAILRAMRPGSIETEEQEAFIRKFVQHLYKVASQPKVIIPEPDHPLIVTGTLPPRVSIIVLCGLPGSGKSTFSERLGSRKGFTVVCQDDTGSKAACFSLLASAALKGGKPVIIDRCNPIPESRKEWLAALFNPADAICVYFNYPLDLCVQRADSRPSHPTITQGRAQKIVATFAKQMVAPTLKEGFAFVAEVRSITAANELLRRLGVTEEGPPQLEERNAPPPEQQRGETQGEKAPSRKDIYKFPRTRHLFNLGSATRDDLVLASTDAAAFLDTADGSQVIIEEKIDGANMGISIDPIALTFKVQNRSHYVNGKSHEQFKKLDKWLQDHTEDLFAVLGEDEPDRYILYGEWVYAKHSIPYSRLPDRFVAFDLYDTETDRFSSRDTLQGKLSGTKIHQIEKITIRSLDEKALTDGVLKHPSCYYDGIVEGFYLRKEKGDFLIDRAKIVRHDFIAGNDHWAKGTLEVNGVV